jgi:hypothetical protein
MLFMEHVALMALMRIPYKIFVSKSEGKKNHLEALGINRRIILL